MAGHSGVAGGLAAATKAVATAAEKIWLQVELARVCSLMAAIYERYESTLRPVILNVLHEEGETDDVLHDVFISERDPKDGQSR
jgi:hypothetical protein